MSTKGTVSMRTTEGGGVLGFAIAFLAFAFGGAFGLPASVRLLVIGVGVLVAVLSAGMRGLGLAALVLGGVVLVSSITLFRAPGSAPDLEEPIPVPSAYGFELDPESTNVTHMYDSGPIPPTRARMVAREVVDHYVNALRPDWIVVERDDSTNAVSVQLKAAESSRGIWVNVYVIEQEGRPAFLDLRLQALVCGDDGQCGNAPIRNIVSYPGGMPLEPGGPPEAAPLREPVPVPPGYGFRLEPSDSRTSAELVHVYSGSEDMSDAEAQQAQREVMRHYRRSLSDWVVTETSVAILEVKAPASTEGLSIYCYVTGGVVMLEIESLYCPEDYYCWSTGP
jgi:hypothetical protein